jgi:hypothetical protein
MSSAKTRKKQYSEFKGDFRKLGLDIRVVNALAAQGIFALEDLAQYSERDLARLRGIGPGTRKILQDYLKKTNQSPTDQTPGIILMLPAEIIRSVDDWCLTHQGPIPSRTEAIHTLVEISLTAWKRSTFSSE